MARTPTDGTVASIPPQRYKVAYRDPRALDPPSRAPPPYTLFSLPTALVDKKKSAVDECAADDPYTYIMYIPGISEDTGEPTCILLTTSGFWRVDHASFHGRAYAQLAAAVPADVERAARYIFLSPPGTGPRRIPRPPRSSCRSGYHLLLGHLRPCPLKSTHQHLFGTAAELARRVTADLRPQHTRELHAGMREYRLLEYWRLGALVPAGADGACVVGRYAESAYDKWLRRSGSADGAQPPLSVQRVMLRGCTAGYSDAWPTLAAKATCMPILVPPLPRPPQYASLQLTATMSGYDTDDKLVEHLLTLKHEDAHQLLCIGGANHTWCTVFGTLQQASPLKNVPVWGIRHLFAGGGTFLAARRQIGQPYELLSSSNDTLLGDAATEYVHGADVSMQPDATVVSDRCSPHLTILGFPCPPYSILNQNVTPEDLDQSVSDLRKAFQHVLIERPAVVVMENLPTLLSGKFEDVMDKIDDILFASPYLWMLDVLCPSMDDATITRPRAIWIGFLNA